MEIKSSPFWGVGNRGFIAETFTLHPAFSACSTIMGAVLILINARRQVPLEAGGQWTL
jgi:hypothetical protein